MKRSLLLSGVLVLFIAGCSAPAPAPSVAPTTGAPQSTPQASGAATGDAALPAVTQAAKVAGPIAIKCGETEASVLRVDTTDASVEEISTFTGSAKSASGCIGGTPSGQMAAPRYRQLFSADFKRMAVSWQDSTSNSKRVGYIDSSTGERTDVSELLSDGSDFSSAPQHDNAMFAPDGSFFFRDYKARNFTWVDLSTMKVLRVSTSDRLNGDNWWIGPNGEPESDRNMSGLNYARDIAAEGENQLLALTSDYVAFSWLDSTRALVATNEYVDGKTSRVLGTLKAHTKQADGQSPAGRFAAITPGSDFSFSSAIADDEDATVYFTAARGKESYVFSVPADGSAEPKRIGSVKPGTILIDFANPSDATSNSPSPTAAPTADRSDLVGTWTGPVKGDSSLYDVIAVITESGGALSATVEYPQLSCKATWRQLESGGSGVQMQEKLVSGDCLDNSKVRLVPGEGKLFVEFSGTPIKSTMNRK